MSHLTLQANRATFTFLLDKSSLKMQKIMNNYASFENLSNSVTRQVNLNRTKIGGKYQKFAPKIITGSFCSCTLCTSSIKYNKSALGYIIIGVNSMIVSS